MLYVLIDYYSFLPNFAWPTERFLAKSIDKSYYNNPSIL